MQESIEARLERLRQSSRADDQDFLKCYERYSESCGPAAALLPPASNQYLFEQTVIARLAASTFTTDAQARMFAEIALFNLGCMGPVHPFTEAFMNTVVLDDKDRRQSFPALVEIAAALRIPNLVFAEAVAAYCPRTIRFGWTTRELGPAALPIELWNSGFTAIITEDVPPEGLINLSPIERYLTGLSDEVLALALTVKRQGRNGVKTPPDKMLSSFAKFRPQAIGPWMNLAQQGQRGGIAEWSAILRATDRWDQAMLIALDHKHPSEAILILSSYTETGRSPSIELVRELAMHPEQREHPTALDLLAAFSPTDFLPHFLTIVASGTLSKRSQYSGRTGRNFATAASLWSDGGRQVFETTLAGTGSDGAQLMIDALNGLLAEPRSVPICDTEEWLRKARIAVESTAGAASEELSDFWNQMNRLAPTLLVEERFLLLGHKNKTMRALAFPGVRELSEELVKEHVRTLLNASNANSRLGAAELFAELKSAAMIPLIQEAIESERSEKVCDVLLQALSASGGEIEASGEENTEILLAEIQRTAAKFKLPKTGLSNLSSLPPILTTDGETLSESVITWLIARQAKQKEIAAAPDIMPVIDFIDREKSAPFAAALVEGFLNSDQAAADRWALTLGGLLGDKRIINLLLPRIQGWCENSRHKLAEYAAQAISLLPGNEPLMVLDTLANRYRTKFKNIGRACSEAFNAAATARGITADELGDMVVPDFGFDAEGVRRFDWEGGGISAELGADFKLTWFDPETEKSWKTIPAGAPDETKTEVKTVTKLIRETVKAQTARLEMSLVRQRRWPVARWRELYEEHPLLRSFASGLVWGVYDVSGNLLRTFRRYSNGILADAAGAMEELAETDTSIGMVHPLELDQSTNDLWRAHLQRMKVKQAFPQIDRPVELMDPLHGNRREISLTKDRNLSAGTFRSRAEKRGWTRGSVVDAGGIASYYKLYPGAGVEVNLPMDGFYIGCDPMDAIELGAAYFATAGSVERGSYIYDDPSPDDPRVLRFDQVPAVVYSETISDLKAIIATKE